MLLFLPIFFKFHVRKGKLLYLESSWKEKFPFSPISFGPLSARNFKLFPFFGLSQPQAKTTKGRTFLPGSAGQGWGALPGEHMWETYFAVAFFFLKKKGLLWSAKTFICIKFKGSLLLHCIICVRCPKKLNSSLPSPEHTHKQTGSFRLCFGNNAFHWSSKKKSNPA